MDTRTVRLRSVDHFRRLLLHRLHPKHRRHRRRSLLADHEERPLYALRLPAASQDLPRDVVPRVDRRGVDQLFAAVGLAPRHGEGRPGDVPHLAGLRLYDHLDVRCLLVSALRHPRRLLQDLSVRQGTRDEARREAVSGGDDCRHPVVQPDCRRRRTGGDQLRRGDVRRRGRMYDFNDGPSTCGDLSDSDRCNRRRSVKFKRRRQSDCARVRLHTVDGRASSTAAAGGDDGDGDRTPRSRIAVGDRLRRIAVPPAKHEQLRL